MRFKPQDRERYLAKYRANKACFGGELLRGNAKRARPYSYSQGLHVVLRSSLAKGKFRLDSRSGQIKKLIRRQARNFGVVLSGFSVNSNHIHILLRPPRERAAMAHFLRAVSGLVARAALGVERGRAKGLKFWDRRPFSRVVPLGESFRRCLRYVELNVFESENIDGVVEFRREFAGSG